MGGKQEGGRKEEKDRHFISKEFLIILSFSSYPAYEVVITLPKILQMRKLKFREIESLAQGHTALKKWSTIQSSVHPTPKPTCLLLTSLPSVVIMCDFEELTRYLSIFFLFRQVGPSQELPFVENALPSSFQISQKCHKICITLDPFYWKRDWIWKKSMLDIGSKFMVTKGERGWRKDKLRVWN